MEYLSSLQNKKVKQFLLLTDKARERNKSGLFVAEGRKEIGIAVKAGYKILDLFVCEEIWNDANGSKGDIIPAAEHTWSISLPVFEKMAYRKSSDGILAIAYQAKLSLEDMKVGEHPFFIVLESVEKPGNLGAILRTADATHVTGVIVCDPQTDVYNPNVVRSSLGCLFSVPVARCSSVEAMEWLRSHHIQILAAELEASEWYHKTDMCPGTAIVMGTESEGLTPFWIEGADRRIKIPMLGQVDSLNVSVSTAVLAYEAMRQRDFNITL